MRGQIIYLMGPSGSGKDALLETVRRLSDGRLRVARRITTRGGAADAETREYEESVDPADFSARAKAGDFSLSWNAHGIEYGIPKEIDAWTRDGLHVLVNGSRAYFPEARRRYPDLRAVLLRVSAEVLRERLRARNRETPEEISSRLERNERFQKEFAPPPLPSEEFLILDNSGLLSHTARQLLDFIHAPALLCA
ncbi:MAG: phosphonate metabolism protein/1,5-bisphosphokinase (PRPP-forming) PhnN [Zoogloeaceae bacterium]|nr:phosphonate metabolism protein/1,5-bisphosphokinase (PRPP-forming) PhnN [Zoogloeaceae bacterium]